MTAGTQRSFQLLLLAIDGNLTGNSTRNRQCIMTLTAAVTETMHRLILHGTRLQGLGEGPNLGQTGNCGYSIIQPRSLMQQEKCFCSLFTILIARVFWAVSLGKACEKHHFSSNKFFSLIATNSAVEQCTDENKKQIVVSESGFGVSMFLGSQCIKGFSWGHGLFHPPSITSCGEASIHSSAA